MTDCYYVVVYSTFAWYGAGPFLFKLIVDRYGTPQFLAGMMMFLMSLIGGNIGLWIGKIYFTYTRCYILEFKVYVTCQSSSSSLM